MDQKDIVMINGKELMRLKIVQEVIEKHITQLEAVSIIGLSERQMRRMVKKVRVEAEVHPNEQAITFHNLLFFKMFLLFCQLFSGDYKHIFVWQYRGQVNI